MGYIDGFEDVMKFEERWLSHTIYEIKEQFGREIERMFGIDIKVPEVPFPRIEMEEAYDILESRGVEVEKGGDLSSEGEKELSEYVMEEFGHEFVFVTLYPWSVRPFYHMKDNSGMHTLSFDLLWKGLEITTGAQREHRYEVLKNQAAEKGLDLRKIDFYLEFFKYGCPPHGGFGLSPTRVVMKMLNLPNVRESTLLPRDPNRLTP